ncbi:MAG: hypothetical protein L0Y74_07815, partial [candidate division Zixibacteria bacterium]|nr:hypothetical protein [candidate division Zixibacteria bacterium]
MAISPWSIQLSRGAFEANLASCLLPLSLAAFLAGKAYSGVILLAINLFSYHSARLVSLPVVGLTYIITRFKLNRGILILFALLVVPTFFSFNSRVSDVGIWSPTDSWSAVSDRRFESINSGVPDPIARLFSNKAGYLIDEIWSRYSSYYSPQFLFSSGPAESTYGMLQGRGVIYLIEVVFILSFVVMAIRFPGKPTLLLLLLLFLLPIPASLAKGPGYAANRAVIMLPVLIIIISSGLVYFLNLFKKQKKLFVTLLVCTLYLFHFTFFLEDYFIHGPRQLARGMLFGYRELFSRALPIADTYSAVRVSRSLSEPHIYYAF